MNKLKASERVFGLKENPIEFLIEDESFVTDKKIEVKYKSHYFGENIENSVLLDFPFACSNNKLSKSTKKIR